MKSEHPIAIVGIGGIFPDAPTLENFWTNIETAASASREVPDGRWPLSVPEMYVPERGHLDTVYSTRGCCIRDFELDNVDVNLDPALIQALDPVFHLGLHAARQALLDAVIEPVDRRRVGVILGSIALPTQSASAITTEILGRTFEEQVLGGQAASGVFQHAGTHPVNRYAVGMTAALIARAFGLGGGNYTIDGACAASLYALRYAVAELQAGRADAMLTGGLCRPDNAFTQMGFCQLGALSPSGVCAPFDQRGDGLVVGEGAGLFVLKRLEDARRDGDRVYAVIRGIGLSNDQRGNLLAPDSAGQVRAMQAAYRQAGWSPQDVDLIECHATGTPVGDAVEFDSLKQLWQDRDWQAQQCVIGGVKSNVGHLLTGAGAAGLMKVVLALKHETLPPTANFVTPDPRLDMLNSPFSVLTSPQSWTRRTSDIPRRAAVSAFGFGGINAHVLLEEWNPDSKHAASVSVSGSEGSQQATASANSPIAVVGLDAYFGPWRSLRAFQERVLGGGEAVEPIRNPHDWGVEQASWFQNNKTGDLPKGYFIDTFAIPIGTFRIPPKELQETLPQQLLMLRVAANALEDARASRDIPDDEVERCLRSGVFIGIGLDPNATNFSFRWRILDAVKTWNARLNLKLNDDELRQWAQRLRDAFHPPLTANRTVGALGGIVASRIAREFKFGGPGITLSGEESSGLRAVELAVRALQEGDIDRAVAGAVDLNGDLRSVLMTHALRSMADGTDSEHLIGEGAAAVVLKRLDDAQRDGDRIYAVLNGLGAASARQPAISYPDASTYQAAREQAQQDAAITSQKIHYLETDGRISPDAISPDSAVGNVSAAIGDAGAANGIAAFVKTCLALYQQIIPPRSNSPDPYYWLRNCVEGARRAAVSSGGIEGNCLHAVLQEYEERSMTDEIPRLQPVGAERDALLTVSAASPQQLRAALASLRESAERSESDAMEAFARDWWQQYQHDSRQAHAIAFLSSNREELLAQISTVSQTLDSDTPPAFPGNRIFYRREPIMRAEPSGKIAFVFPGSGNHYPGMGRAISVRWPEILRHQDRDNQALRDQYIPDLLWNTASPETMNQSPDALLLGQVAYGTMMTDLLRSFGIRPDAAIGYSLGESTALFSLHAWTERDEMLRRVRESTLFTHDLAGEYRAARRAWNLADAERVDWMIAAVQARAAEIRAAIQGQPRVYLLIINTPGSCVIGGDRPAVLAVLERLTCQYQTLHGVSTAHCDVLEQVREPYRALHWFETTQAPEGIDFYSGAWCRAYDVTADNAADAILAQASTTVDFPSLVRKAYDDGVRVFLEVGPGNTCAVMIDKILADRRHCAVSACAKDTEHPTTVLQMLGKLIAEGVPVDLAGLYGQETQVIGHQRRAQKEAKAITLRIGGDAFQVDVPAKRESKPVETAKSAPLAPQPERAANPPQPAEKIEQPGEPVPPDVRPQPESSSTPAAPIPEPQVPMQNDVNALIQDVSAAHASTTQAHAAYLKLAQGITDSYARQLALQMAMLEEDSGVRKQESGNRSQESGLRSQDSGVRTQDSGLRTQDSGVRTQDSGSKEQGTRHKEQGERNKGQGARSEERGTDLNPDESWSLTPEASNLQPESWSLTPEASNLKPVFMNREQCFEFAIGSIAQVLGPEFAEVDTHPTRVRLPDEPLMLVDRILEVEGEARSMTHGRVVTEHDIFPDDWYLDCERIPTCIAVESGQADLFLSGYLGIDFITKGLAVYRLLDAEVTFHRDLPGPGTVLRYDIHIDEFFRQGNTYLFRFRFDCTVQGELLLTMRKGCAGFFSRRELEEGQGLVFTSIDRRPMPGTLPDDWQPLTDIGVEAYSDAQVDALRRGDLAACFGSQFANLPLRDPCRLPGGRMKLVDRVLSLDPQGGRYGLGQIRGEADIHPDDWFLICHFVDDQVMPGTLMYECCLHTLRILLMRMGWVGEQDEVAWEPVPGVAGQLKCRGQVIATTRTVIYEISIKELGYRPEPYVICDAIMYADNKPVVRMNDMSLRLSGTTREALKALWGTSASQMTLPRYERKPAIFDSNSILAFSNGKPSEAFGERYQVFDAERIIARLPGPPYQFLDRVIAVEGEQWVMKAGASAEAQYDVPPEVWYFAANRQSEMPFAVLLEIVLQPCGWLAAYVGSALTSEIDLSFRNLGGTATQYLPVEPHIGTLTTTVTLTNVSQSGGMIIQHYDYTLRNTAGDVVYQGNTYFGFFTKQALANQVGLRDAQPYQPDAAEVARAETFAYPQDAPFPDTQMRMVDRIDLFVADGGPQGLGFIRGSKQVQPEEWFFKAHFYQDPVWPGSLGLEAFLQLLKVAAVKRWGGSPQARFETMARHRPHQWTYRGQVIPTDQQVTIQAVITAIDDEQRLLEAEGVLIIDGRIIYQMQHFTLRLSQM